MGIDEEKEKEKEKDKEMKIEILIKEEHIRRIFNAYSNIKNFLIEYIYGENTLSTQNGIDVYLVSTKSIPNFIKILKKQFNKEIRNESELMDIEKKLREKFKDYIIEKNIVIYNNYQNCLDIINQKKNNEFILTGEKFFTNFEIESKKYKGREVKIIEINKKEKKMIIKFPTSEKILEAKEKQKGYFQLNAISTYVENNIISQTISYSLNKKESNELKLNKNQNKFQETMIQSIVYCLLNIKSLYENLVNNNINITNEKKISYIFYLMANQIKNKNYNFDFSDLIKIIKSYNMSNSKNIVEIIFQNLHLELRNNEEKIYTKLIQKDEPDPIIEILNANNEFEKKGKSIIGEIFSFQDIITYQCLDCRKITDCKSTIKYNFLFPLKDIINFKQNPSQLNIYDCFDYLTQSKNDDIICIHCHKQAKDNYRINSTKEILTIVLDRGDNFKNEIDFKLDLKIDLTKYFFNQDNKYIFELIGFCCFYKEKKLCFPFYKNDENNKWYYYDGLNIKIYTYDININAPFLLFYKIIQ